MILDSTAGNRSIWTLKTTDKIIYIDIEKKLERKPTIFADNRKTPFKPKLFDTIFYDPPYFWGSDNLWYMIPDSKTYYEMFKEKRSAPRYYGVDKFKSKSEMISSIHYALKEFYRILKDDGLLWLKWCEIKVSLSKIIVLFNNWELLIKLMIKDILQTHSDCQTYWLTFTKKLNSKQKILKEFK